MEYIEPPDFSQEVCLSVRSQGVIPFNTKNAFYSLGALLFMTKGNAVLGLLQGSGCRMSVLKSSCSIYLIHVEQ